MRRVEASGACLGLQYACTGALASSTLHLPAMEVVQCHLAVTSVLCRPAGVSESIIMGIPFATGGTGMTKLRYAPAAQAAPTRRPDPVLA